MKCSARQVELILFVDDEISDEEKLVIDSHLQECENCMSFVNAVRSARAYAGKNIKCDRDLLVRVKEKLDKDYYKNKSYRIIHKAMFYFSLCKPLFAVVIIVLILLSLLYFDFFGVIKRTFY
ncbi:MAG: zf-HC2 domain-containing protein [Clostridiaceae bacterium]|nr:zf-HC2 domain-containing protein [Clostridiaceae bacterium]